jgi:hypothetical protein
MPPLFQGYQRNDGEVTQHNATQTSAGTEIFEIQQPRPDEHLARSRSSCMIPVAPLKCDSLLFQLESSPIYLQSALTVVSLVHILLIHKCQRPLNELSSDAQRTFEDTSESEESTKLSEGKYFRENQVCGICIQSPTVSRI